MLMPRFLSACLLFGFLHLPAGAQISEPPSRSADDSNIVKNSKGSWGDIEYFYVYLEASDSLMERFPLPSTITRWAFPRMEMSELGKLLKNHGLTEASVLELLSNPATIKEGDWIYLFPTINVLRSLSTEARASLYTYLAGFGINTYQQSPIYFPGESVESWARDSELGPDIVQLIKDWSYPRNGILAFSDIPALLGGMKGEARARELFGQFTRTRTVMPRLVIDETSNIPSILEYWTTGLNLRRKDLEPMLRSLQRNKNAHYLDLSHLLPAFARKLLFTYPDSEMITQGLLPDCHWTTLNFFGYDAQNYYLTQAAATSAVLENFERIEPPYRFGDVLMFLTSTDGAVHSCNYIAADIVFTKNGRSPAMPWMFMELTDLARIYDVREGGTRIQGFRHKRAIAAGK